MMSPLLNSSMDWMANAKAMLPLKPENHMNICSRFSIGCVRHGLTIAEHTHTMNALAPGMISKVITTKAGSIIS